MIREMVCRKLGRSKLPIPGRIFRWCLVLSLFAIGGRALTDVSSAHGPHGWLYPLDCCYGDGKTGNCQMIPAGTVTETPDGFMVVLNPGDHGMVTRRQTFRIPYGKERRSVDHDYHICLHPRRSTAGCFFAPPRTM
jgi:hypothetical protein